MKKCIAFVVCVLILSTSVFAGGREKAAEELLLVMEMDQTLAISIDNMIELQLQQKPQLEQFKDVMIEFMNKYLSFESLKEELIEIYASAFSKDELHDLITFYKTDTGKKTINVLPELTQKAGLLGMKRVTDNQAELQEMLMQSMVEQQK